MSILACYLIGIFISLGFSLDLFITEKKKGFFLRAFIYALGVALPKLYNGGNISEVIYGFTIGFIVSLLLIYYFVYKKILKKIELNDDNDPDLEFFNLLMNGYYNFKENISVKIKEIEKNKASYNKTFLRVHKDLSERLPSFIINIYSYIHTNDDDFTKYATYVMQSFINEFFANSNASFTLRVYNEDINSMKAEITTRKVPPNNIPLSEPNMISESLKLKKPLIYSENLEVHFDTKQSMHKNKFDDYVTYCIIETENSMPAVSLNLDVKGEESVNRMQAFVKTNIFTIVCDAISLNYKIKN